MMEKRKSQHEVTLQRLDSVSNQIGSSSRALGLENKDIPDNCITASSTAPDCSTNNARLNCKRGAWSPSLSSVNPYLQVDLGCLHDVTAVATQGVGNTGADRFVKEYKLQFSRDEKVWDFYQEGKTFNQVLQGNKDSTTAVKRNLYKAYNARFVRFYPIKWYEKPCMRVEVYGNQSKKAQYDTSVKISDHHGKGINGCPVLQFSIQLFGENGYTRKIPLEIEAKKTANQKDNKKLDMDFKRNILAADVGWIKHLKLSYDAGSDDSEPSSPTLIEKFRRLSSTSSSNDDLSSGESGFFVEEITIDVKETGQHFTFTCKQWILQKQSAFDPSHRHKSRLASTIQALDEEDFGHILKQEAEDTHQGWRKIKRGTGCQSWKREPTEMETTPLTKSTFVIDGIPYNDTIRLLTDWNLRVKWDETFKTVIIVDEDINTNVVYCCLKMPRLYRPWEIVLSTMDYAYSTPQPYHVIAWCSTEHSSVAESDRSTLDRVHVRLSGMVVRPVGEGSTSCKVTLLTRMRVNHNTPRPIKNTYLNGNPTQWIEQLKEYYKEHGISDSKETDEVFETERLLTDNQ